MAACSHELTWMVLTYARSQLVYPTRSLSIRLMRAMALVDGLLEVMLPVTMR